MINTKKILFGLTTGIIFGAGLTSRKGVAMRKEMFARANQYANVLKEKSNQSIGSLSGNFNKFLKKIGLLFKGENSQKEKKKELRDLDSTSNGSD
ncbi:hypothetical protein FNH22_27930 [Fulvivirga sp. M361]|uniref:hypothetical protein n=1 Tax=Fulvivirga sp. M361 TaxID=2594266 RepID=UPI00117A0D87|nr:hypothetical protein [Fulvivirga sp. M361]TRX49066.1 hypothetical protein FNH22_27930 [Fulvivirga sp. M361]